MHASAVQVLVSKLTPVMIRPLSAPRKRSSSLWYEMWLLPVRYRLHSVKLYLRVREGAHRIRQLLQPSAQRPAFGPMRAAGSSHPPRCWCQALLQCRRDRQPADTCAHATARLMLDSMLKHTVAGTRLAPAGWRGCGVAAA